MGNGIHIGCTVFTWLPSFYPRWRYDICVADNVHTVNIEAGNAKALLYIAHICLPDYASRKSWHANEVNKTSPWQLKNTSHIWTC